MLSNRNSSRIIFILLILGFVFYRSSTAMAQENPPIPIQVEVNNAQFLNFGSFTAGTSIGSVTVDPYNVRTYTGDVQLLNFGASPSAALFDLTANPGTIINIQTPSQITLTGTDGGEIQLEIDSYSTGQVFVTTAIPPATNNIYVGGTLHLGTQSKAGVYNGTFNITFNHE